MWKDRKSLGPKVRAKFWGLRLHRQTRNLTQEELADEADVSLPTIGRAERLEWVSLDTALAICGALDVKLAEVAEVDVNPIIEHQFSFADASTKSGSADLLFDNMLAELGKHVGENVAKEAMDKLFQQMRFFPMGGTVAQSLGRIKTFDLDGFLTILKLRAVSISRHLDDIIDGRRRLIDDAKKEQNAELPKIKGSRLGRQWKEQFTGLHEQHVHAILNGQLLIAHEIRSQIAELLEMIAARTQTKTKDTERKYFFPRIYSSH